ncbi:MAG: low molecular weight phosphotyrosine protein phosphatase [Gammaproteobacteria bacterium]|nr:low molecular weight phosphotyrosine protein phosphatase [Gammaproteobacteria bacterium]
MKPLSEVNSVLFVCMGNICRSPAGENVMRAQLEQVGLADVIRCDSAGTAAYHVGEPPDQRMIATGQRRGYPMTGTARKVTRQDLDDFDLVLAMDDDNYHHLLNMSGDAPKHDIRRFCEFLTHFEDSAVPDPYYGGAAGFDYVIDLLEDGCAHLITMIRRQRTAG